VDVGTWRGRFRCRLRRLRWQVTPHPLTKLTSPAAFKLRAWSCRLTAETTVAVIDLDRFSYINDRFGHQVGDEVLVAVAAQLRTRYQQPGALLNVGSRFFAIAPGAAPAEVASDLAGALHDIERDFRHLPYTDVDGAQRTLTASAGVARASGAAPTLVAMAAAQDAVYAAKRAGGGQVRIAGA
jgi:diguanylate cyclase (GGDEF)-like protein